MTRDWTFRVGDGENFINSSGKQIWGVQSTNPVVKYFLKHVNSGDRLWFIQSKSNGRIIAVVTYRSHNKREFGELISPSMTNEELGWIGENTKWISDIEIHYTDLYNVTQCELLTHMKGPGTVVEYNENCRVDLPVEYSHIVRYCKVTFNMFN